MGRRIKIHKGRWKDNKPSAYEISEVSSMDIDASFNSINEKLKSIRGMEPIDYQSIDNQMEKANELLEGVCYYIGETLDDIDAYIDTPFYDRFNHKTGILESFEKINLDNYKTKNVLGIKEHGSKQVYDYPNGRYKTEVYEEELEEIGFKDILSNLDVKGKPGMPSFAQMMEEQYRNAVTNRELDVSYDDYVEALLHRSDIEHTVDKGWLNYVSDGLETIGVISFVGMITGENFITGEILTDREKEQAGLNTIVNVGVLLATIASAGGGSLAALGLKQGLIEGAKLGAKTLAVDMISGISGLATVNLLEAAGSPEYMAVIAGMGMSFLGGYCGEKYISKVGSITNVTVDNKGVDISSVDEWLKDMSPEDTARYRQRLDLLESKKLNATKSIEKIDDITKGVSVAEIPKDIKYSPINPCDKISQEVAESFRSATFTEKVLTEDTIMYRVSGGKAGEVGSYLSKTPQGGGLQSQLDLALNPSWGNTTEVVTKVVVPKGTVVYEGLAAPQNILDSLGNTIGTLPGGGNQIYIPKVDAGWFK